jgi:hypothetical protein
MIMKKCKFDLSIPVLGLDFDTYDVINLGDKFAKILDIKEIDETYRILLNSSYKRYDFKLEIESIWDFNIKKNVFKLTQVLVELAVFDLLSETYAIPESHISTLKKWYENKF